MGAGDDQILLEGVLDRAAAASQNGLLLPLPSALAAPPRRGARSRHQPSADLALRIPAYDVVIADSSLCVRGGLALRVRPNTLAHLVLCFGFAT